MINTYDVEQKAVIFDMDGVIIDSEKLWKKAEFEIFSSLGVKVTEELTLITQAMTTREVTEFWKSRFAWKDVSVTEVEQLVISRVIELIESESCEIPGIRDFIVQIKKQGYKVGLATNSPYRIIPVVLEKLNLSQYFDAISSSDFEVHGKPHPGVYLSTSVKLNVKPVNCIAIEDSYSGMIAAKKAGMTVTAFTNGNLETDVSLAAYVIDDFRAADLSKIKNCMSFHNPN